LIFTETSESATMPGNSLVILSISKSMSFPKT
jgi:hypothetical protein